MSNEGGPWERTAAKPPPPPRTPARGRLLLWLLGVEPIKPMDGRVLYEALVASQAPEPTVKVRKLEATRETGLFRWSQYLQFSEVNGTLYFDEGNGEPALK